MKKTDKLVTLALATIICSCVVTLTIAFVWTIAIIFK